VCNALNEADWALIGVGDVHLRSEYNDMQKAKSEWCCSAESNAHVTHRTLSTAVSVEWYLLYAD